MPIEEVDYIWFNGEVVPWHDANIHVLTYGLLYGSGVFEGERCYKTAKGPAVFRLDDHNDRLYDSAKIYRMSIPFSKGEIAGATKDIIRKNRLDECYIRPIVFRGYGEAGLNPLNSKVDVAIAPWPWGAYLGDDGMEKGVRCMVSSWRRPNSQSTPMKAKALGNYQNAHLAKIEAVDCGYDEAIMLDSRGFVSEGPAENIFMVKKGILYTPPLHASILPGITRDTIIRLARDNGIEVRETDITREDLYNADELFFTGTAVEVTPVREVDNRTIGCGMRGMFTQKLQKTYFSVVRGDIEKYEDWLSYI